MMNETELAFRKHIVEHQNEIQELGHPTSAVEGEILKDGTAKVDTNEGGGQYTITEQWWTDVGWSDATTPGGLVGETAYDISNLDDGAVNDVVSFWQERAKDGSLITLIMQKVHGIPPGGDQYEVLQKTSGTDYAVSWDYVRGHG